jgi:hypothetical protein
MVRLTVWQTDTVIKHPDVVFYDFYKAYDDPIPADEEMYLGQCARSSKTGR